ncbi:META domain-containing protein [Synergistaceae bacterium OttesenSCG-928-D05]|nr:META domain-containing protein [Synergistaceae bacterium OttesenSCG-928-D05]
MKKTLITSLVIAVSLAVLLTASAFAYTGELGGTNWRVTGINNGKQAVVSTLAGTELTANFGRNGILSGSAGCNTYTATYDLYGNIVKIGTPASTRKMCMTPEGIMEQETIFLNALENTRSWRLMGGNLDLLGEDGSISLSLVPAATDETVFLYRNPDGKEALVEMFDTDKLTMTIDGKTYPMQQTISASGARYEALGDPKTVFWSKGDKAYVAVEGKDLPDFDLVQGGAAKQTISAKPTVYRAGIMEVLVEDKGDDHILLTANGETFWLKRVPAASGARYVGETDATTEFWSHDEQATLSIKGVPYPGGMLTRDDEPNFSPAATLMDVEWYVESVAGKNILPNSMVTMFFKSDGRLYGKASINTYNSSWVDSGNKLMIGESATTMMAGSPDLMEQEQRFLKSLSDVNAFEVKDGKLHLSMKGGGEIIAKR